MQLLELGDDFDDAGVTTLQTRRELLQMCLARETMERWVQPAHNLLRKSSQRRRCANEDSAFGKLQDLRDSLRTIDQTHVSRLCF